jgi:hypothetical protein
MRGRLRLMTASSLIRIATCLTAMASAGGCGSDAPPPILLMTGAEWNDYPAALDRIGYRVSVDFGWPSRAQSCFSLPPDLTVTMNERQATPTQLGECVWDMLVTFDAVPPDAPVHVRVASGSHVYGEAGTQFTVALPPTAVPVSVNLGAGYFYWLDTPPSAVPFYTFAPGMDGPDQKAVVITAPATTGRATLIVKSVFQGGFGTASSCTGFDSCTSWPSSQAAGPIAVDVVP